MFQRFIYKLKLAIQYLGYVSGAVFCGMMLYDRYMHQEITWWMPLWLLVLVCISMLKLKP